MRQEIDGFDPLVERGAPGGLDQSIADEAIRREVGNILKSYTGYFDLFSELMQNALDALDNKKRLSTEDFQPRIYVEIDIENNRVRVVDNGCGMSLEQFKFCFRPNVSFKSRKESRGHKGVGATFVAYGFSSVKLQTKIGNTEIAGQLKNGRRWTEDNSNSFHRPKFESHDFDVSELRNENSGTAVEVIIEDQQRPQLSWIQATNADQWIDLFRIKTPIGGIYLTAKERDLNVEYEVVVRDITGSVTKCTRNSVDYYYPHELPNISKTKSISEIEHQIKSISGDPTLRLQKLPDDFRRLDAVYEVWLADDIINEPSFNRNLDEAQKILVQKHKISLYGCFLSSATTWTSFQKEILKVRQNAILLRGGLQLASDFMPQGELSVIPLTSTIGYQNNTHIVIHLTDGNPDMGRKVFQPEIKALSDELARRTVDIFKRYLSLMREDTGAPTSGSARNLRDFIKQQEAHREKAPIALAAEGRQISILSEPQSEQDVIALFHQLQGVGVLKGYGIFSTSESEQYDSVFLTKYDDPSHYYSSENPLGVQNPNDIRESVPYILEYKFDSDALVADFSKQVKFIKDINLVVCWELGSKTTSEFQIRSYLVGDEGSTRSYFGSTHALFHGRELRMEMICLKDLLKYLIDPDTEAAVQKQKYST